MNKKNYIQLLTAIWITAFSFLLTGCSDEYPDERAVGKETVSINLNLSMPGLVSTGTKAMSHEQESAIDESKLQILVFEMIGPNEEFRYQAEITNKSLPQITLKVPTGTDNQKFRFVVLANAEPQTIEHGTSKENVLEKFFFDCLGEWDASPSAPSKIPMWGELGAPIIIKKDQWINILLHRALARVDVGVLFKFNNPDPDTKKEYPQEKTDKESVYGMDNFKIKDIRVYRTHSKAYVASSVALMSGNEVITPSIPASAKYNSGNGTEYTERSDADKDPLVYTLTDAADSYIREIYIPESAITSGESNMDNVPCLVVGGYYGKGNPDKVTYYRADFANYENGAVTAYRPILRNHQYVFDIKTVNGPGFEKPEEALNSISSPMDLDLVAWNQMPLGFYTQGDYFLNVQDREIWLEARVQDDQTKISYKVVPFQTNLELNGEDKKKFNYVWKSNNTIESSYFEMDIDYIKNTFTFKANNTNEGADKEERIDTVAFTVENFKFDIIVHQKAYNLNYSLSCEHTEVHGRYREGVPLNYTNFISVKVTSTEDMDGKAYELKTEEKNGIYFKAEGTFNSGKSVTLGYEYTLILEGYGTPVNETEGEKLDSIKVKISTNSINEDQCPAIITLGYKTKRILTIGANAVYRYGYMLEPNTASRAFVDASINFGVDKNSTVFIEENKDGNAFTIEVMTNGAGMSGESIHPDSLRNKLNQFKPDIILTGQAINYDVDKNEVIPLLAKFVEEGGVFLMFNEYYPVAKSIEAMVKAIMEDDVKGDKSFLMTTQQLFTISGANDDPIVNGPFGDVRSKQWGADGHEMYGFTDLPGETIIYSTRSGMYATMFRHETKGFFFVGDGGFISNSKRYIGDSYQGNHVYFPFAIDASYRPVPRKNFSTSGSAYVYNSVLFGNILAWAVDYSEKRGINYLESGNKFE